MGQAKRRATARDNLLSQVDLPRLSAGMRKLATAASGNLEETVSFTPE